MGCGPIRTETTFTRQILLIVFLFIATLSPDLIVTFPTAMSVKDKVPVTNNDFKEAIYQ
jgi:hypothetical protein